MDATPAKAPVQPSRRRRRLRRTLLIAAPLLVVLLAAVFAVTRGPIARRLVLDRLRSLVVGEVEIGSASMGLDGTIRITDIRLRTSGIPGEPGEVIRADSARLSVSGLWSGAPAIARVEIRGPVVRVSQDKDTGELNLTSIEFRAGGAGKAELPDIAVTGGVIELGEHAGADYHMLRRLPVRGVLTPGQQPGSYVFEIVHAQGGQESARLTGTITDRELDVVVSAMDLAAWPNDAVPTRYRRLHDALNLKGRIRPTRIRVPREGAVELSVRLEGVELDLPLDQTPVARGHMTGVNGILKTGPRGVRADLSGLLDGVPAQAMLTASSLDAGGAFRGEIHVGRVRLNENLHRLGYLPVYVREQLALFSNPTAELELDLVLERPPGASDVLATGSFRLFDGVASFRDFPYEFTGVSALFLLENDRLEFGQIEGVSRGGAQVRASGWVSPLSEVAEAEVNVHVTGVPLDNQLRSGFSDHDRSLYDSLLDRAAYDRIVTGGLIVTGRQKRLWERERNQLGAAVRRGEVEDPAAAGERIAELERLIESAPAFDLGGTGSVDIRVYRHPGPENRWDTAILVELPRVGLLSEHFPLPIVAENLSLRVFNGEAELTQGAFHGLEGGTAHVQAAASLDRPARLPRLHIEARGVPVTPLLLQAIPGPRSDEPDGTTDIGALLAGLGLTGTVDCEASVGLESAPAFEIRVTPNAMSARPDAWTAPDGTVLDALTLGRIDGSILVRPGELDLNLSADLPLEDRSLGRAVVDARAAFGEAIGDRLRIERLEIDLADFDARCPAEQLVAVVSTETAGQLARLRRSYEPAGVADAHLSYEPDAGGLETMSLALSDVRDASVALLGGRLAAERAGGTILVHRGERLGARFHEFGGPSTFDGKPLGTVRVDGDVTLNPDGAEGSIEVTLEDGRFESPVIGALLAERAPSLRDLIEQSEPAGRFDLRARVELTDRGDAEVVETELRPTSLAFTRRGRRLEFPDAAGLIVLAGTSGRVEGFALSNAGLSLHASGSFSVESPDELDAQVEFALDAASFDDDARVLLPEALVKVLSSIRLSGDGPVRLEEGGVLFARRPEGDQIEVLGRVMVERGGASIGVEISEAVASLEFSVHVHPTLVTPQFEIQLQADSARASGVWLSDVRCPIRSSGDGNAVEVGPFSANSHDGRVAGSALVWSEPGDERARFDLRILASGVRFAPVLADLALDTAAPDPEAAADDSRGVIDAQLTLYGVVDGPRRGMGLAQVSEGRVLRLPLLVPLIEVSNLQLPRGEKLEVAASQFYIRNELVTFESLSVLSKSIELIGYGTMSLPERTLDLRINSRSTRRVPFVSAMLEGVRDELLTTRVRGTLGDPDISSEQFATTRRALSTLLGHQASDQDKLLSDIKQRAMQHRGRLRVSHSAIRRVVESVEEPENNQNP